MMTSARITAVLTAALALGCSGDDPVAVDRDLSPNLEVALSPTVKLVPFKATQTATPADASAVVCPAGEQAGRNSVTGNGTHFGKYTGDTVGCLNHVTGVWSSIDGTVVAANGDGLTLQMDPFNPGRFVSIDFATGDFETTGGLIIVGGTGRFAGASGFSTFRSVGNLFIPGSTVTTNVGMISSPGSIR